MWINADIPDTSDAFRILLFNPPSQTLIRPEGQRARAEFDSKTFGSWGGGREGGQSVNESVTLRQNIWFPCGIKKKTTCQSPECNQELLCGGGSCDGHFPLLRLHAEADERNT